MFSEDVLRAGGAGDDAVIYFRACLKKALLFAQDAIRAHYGAEFGAQLPFAALASPTFTGIHFATRYFPGEHPASDFELSEISGDEFDADGEDSGAEADAGSGDENDDAASWHGFSEPPASNSDFESKSASGAELGELRQGSPMLQDSPIQAEVVRTPSPSPVPEPSKGKGKGKAPTSPVERPPSPSPAPKPSKGKGKRKDKAQVKEWGSGDHLKLGLPPLAPRRYEHLEWYTSADEDGVEIEVIGRKEYNRGVRPVRKSAVDWEKAGMEQIRLRHEVEVRLEKELRAKHEYLSKEIKREKARLAGEKVVVSSDEEGSWDSAGNAEQDEVMGVEAF